MIYSSPWTRPLLIPSYFALASIVVLILQAIFSWRPVKRLWLHAPIGAAVEDESEGAAAGESSVVVAGGSSDGTRTGLVSAVWIDHIPLPGRASRSRPRTPRALDILLPQGRRATPAAEVAADLHRFLGPAASGLTARRQQTRTQKVQE